MRQKLRIFKQGEKAKVEKCGEKVLKIFVQLFPLKKFSHSMNHLNQFQKNKTF